MNAWKRLVAAAAAAMLVGGCTEPVSKSGSEVTARRVALTGVSTKLEFLTALHPDCSFIDYPTTRTLVSPSHGKLTMEPGTDFTNYAMNNQRFDCNKEKSPGTLVSYQSDPGYVGSDTAKLDVIYPDASLRTITFRLTVGNTAEEQGARDIPAVRTMVSGSLQKLDFQYSINPDCTSVGETKIRVTRPPSHGALKIEAVEDYTAFAKSNPRYDCNKQRVPGMMIYYQSGAGYTGEDSAKVEVSYPDGTVRSIAYTLVIK